MGLLAVIVWIKKFAQNLRSALLAVWWGVTAHRAPDQAGPNQVRHKYKVTAFLSHHNNTYGIIDTGKRNSHIW
jgi:hypothetical protein